MSDDSSTDSGKKFKFKAKKAPDAEGQASEPTVKANPGKEITQYDVSSYNTLLADVKKLSLAEYGILCHREIKDATMLLKGEKGSYKISDINDLLVKYPSNFAWSIIAAELLRANLEEIKDDFASKGKVWYKEAESKLEKATVKAIEAEIYSEHGDDVDSANKLIRDMESKVNIAQGMVKVWGNGVNILQSLSKNVVSELESAKSRLK
jgi:hypothetical protein